MSPWTREGGKRRWKPPTAEARAKAGLSPLKPTQTGYVAPATKAVQAGDVTGGGMSPAFRAKYEQALKEQAGPQMGVTAQAQSIYQPQPSEPEQAWELVKNWFKPEVPGEPVYSPEKAMEAIKALAVAGTLASTAWFGMSLLGIGSVATGLKVTAKTASLYKTTGVITGGMAANTATSALTAGAIAKSGVIKWGLALYLIKEAQESIVFGKFQLVEGLDKLGHVRTRLIREGLDDSNEGLAVQEAIEKYTDMMNWYRMNIPWLASKIGTDANLEAAAITRDAWDLISEEQKEALAAGKEDVFDYEAYLTKKDAIEDANREAWKQDQLNIIAAKEAARIRGDKRSIRMYEEHRIKMLGLEEEAAERNRKFWLEYLRIKFMLQDEAYGRSHLGFGLL